MPSTIEFSLLAFWLYILIQYNRFGYFSDLLAGMFLVLWVLVFALTKYVRLLFGLDYLFNLLVTDLYGLSYLVLCLSFENDILKFSEDLGFNLIKSRELKFTVFFYLSLIFGV